MTVTEGISSQAESSNTRYYQSHLSQTLIEKISMIAISESLAMSASTVIQNFKEFAFNTILTKLPTNMRWYEYSFKKGKMSFITQNFDPLNTIVILDGRTQTTIRNHFQRYSRQARSRVRHVQIINLLDVQSHEYKTLKRYWNLRSSIFKLKLNQSGSVCSNKIVVNSVINNFNIRLFICT